MFPGDEVLAEWVAHEPQREEERTRIAKAETVNTQPPSRDSPPTVTSYPQLGFAIKSSESSRDPPRSGGGATAAQMFLGVAVTGFIMGDKRVNKYVEKKLKK
jgi:hypothetical protein